MIRVVVLVAIAAFASPAFAGLHYSGEIFADFPVKWRGYLLDHRDLRFAAVAKPGNQPASPLREEYLIARSKLESEAKKRPLTAEETADLGALLVRLGEPQKAVEVLRPAVRANPDHFRLAANLGTAWQQAGDLTQAAAALEDAVRLAPAKLRDAEGAHLKLVRSRLREPKGPVHRLDDLFGTAFAGQTGKPEAGKLAEAEQKKLPANATATLQQLALWLPADGRLLWQLGELANASGDVRTAAAILDGCVTELGLGSPDLRARRAIYRTAADELAKQPSLDTHKGNPNAKSDRALVRAFDESQLSPIRTDAANPLPWAALAATKLDALGKPTFLKHIEALDGQLVSLTGFMQPLREELELSSFLLVEYPVGCWFCESPEVTGMVLVEMKPGRKGELKKGLIRVEGTLSLNRTDPEGFLFTLRDSRQGEPN